MKINKNQCSGCGYNFITESLFFAHRVFDVLEKGSTPVFLDEQENRPMQIYELGKDMQA